jgi:hypothetical protein
VEVNRSGLYDGEFLSITTDDGTNFDVTADYPIWVIESEALNNRPQLRYRDAFEDSGRKLPGRWVNSQFLRVGDLLNCYGSRVRIREIRSYDERQMVYNLTILGLPYYAVSPIGILVHNATETPGTTPNEVPNPPSQEAPSASSAPNNPTGVFDDLRAVRPRSQDRIAPPAGKQVHQGGKFENIPQNEPQIYSVSENGEFSYAPRGDARTGAKHTELTGGAPAKAAGEFTFVGENKVQINAQSGRYIRQSPEAINKVAEYFRSIGYEVEVVTEPF